MPLRVNKESSLVGSMTHDIWGDDMDLLHTEIVDNVAVAQG